MGQHIIGPTFGRTLVAGSAAQAQTCWGVTVPAKHKLRFFYLTNGGSRRTQEVLLFFGGDLVIAQSFFRVPKGPLFWWTNRSAGPAQYDLRIGQYNTGATARSLAYLPIIISGSFPNWVLTAPTGENLGNTGIHVGVAIVDDVA